jgi:mannose-6-phosphate isomerase-like protein (cupin superfamily)
MEKVNLAEKFALFSEHWSPKTIGDINEFAVKIVKVQGEFVWHHHERGDEFFMVVQGRLGIQVREPGVDERTIWLDPGEMLIIPHGIEHCPKAEEETLIMLLEPNTTVNTGTAQSDRTVVPERI